MICAREIAMSVGFQLIVKNYPSILLSQSHCSKDPQKATYESNLIMND